VKRNINIWFNLDKITVFLFLFLIVAGWLNIYAAVYSEEKSNIFDFSQRYGKQFIWIIATLVLAIFVVITDSRFYFFFAWFVYGLTTLLLLLVLVLGREINGARSWFELGGFTFQPTEFAKFGTALALAAYISSKRHDLSKFSVMLAAITIILVPVVLTAIQPDMGSSIVYIALFIVLFREGLSPYVFVSGLLMVILFFLTLIVNNLYLEIGLIVIAILLLWFTTRKWKLSIAGTGVLVFITGSLYVLDKYVFKVLGPELVILISLMLSGLVYAYYIYSKKAIAVLVIYMFLAGSIIFINTVDYTFNNLIKPHQKERVEILLGIKSDLHGKGYNVNQSIISIGSGGLTGKGYLKGTQTKFKFVPAQSTDFIFCTVGEEWGFLGSLLVIGVYVFLLLRLLFLAERQRSVFSRVYGYGVLSILFVHFFVNIGMALGLIPVIGIPLPFFSYGGSSLWGFTILLFIFLRLDASRAEYLL
jgi:rod shape determining protein RodA